jgi:hypothetical protein
MQLKPKDLRRLWIILGEMKSLKPATLTTLHNNLGWSVSTIQRLVERLNSEQLPGIVVAYDDDQLRVSKWGILVNKYYSRQLY